MHFIALLDDRMQKIGRARAHVNIKLRGYAPRTWVPAELCDVELPVNALAYNLCPTSRDIYLEWVEGKARVPTWQRYTGRMIDETYKIIHRKSKEYSSSCRVRNFDLYTHLINEQNDILDEAKRKYQSELGNITPSPRSNDIQALDKALKKIIRFEAEITSAFMGFQIAKVRGATVRRIFDQYFDFNTDLALSAPHQGFRADATPDFIYRHNVVGDIKSGKWQSFFYYTVVAYALAYEEHTGENMNHGVILHVETSRRLIPVHFRTRIELLDDYKRERFLLIRNRKLEIVHDKIDPGLPQSQEDCDPSCSFLLHCWEN